MSSTRRSGFTLVEILIVVIILGILAAIVIPQFTDASTSARTNSMTSSLQTVRSQLELYKVQHNDNYPVLADFTAQKADYDRRGKAVQTEAEKADAAAEADERRALRYDIGEGLLEIALVLSSLYFISRKRMFPVIGVAAGALGMAVAVTGLLV